VTLYSPYAYDIHEDPYPTYAWMRDDDPVHHNPDLGFWALSRYDDVVAGFRDAARLSSADGVSIDPAATGPHAHRMMSFLAMDDPHHGRMRNLVSRAFTPRRVLDLEPRIRELTLDYVRPALDGDRFDFIQDLAGRLPMDVISELIGVDREQRDEVRRLAGLMVHRDEGVMDVPQAGVEAAFTLVGYFGDIIAARRAHPETDMTSALLSAEIDGERLNEAEIMSFLFLMVVAGNETTTKLLGNAWYWAWKHGIVPDETQVQNWVEETLRYDTPTQMLARTATEEITLHDQTIPEGGRVLLLTGSANRDPRAFDEPDVFDLGRDTSALASFGVGRHFCLGASLARLEARVALTELQTRVKTYDIDPDGIERVHSVNVRGFAKLRTEVTPR
jgi:hypothetical protein